MSHRGHNEGSIYQREDGTWVGAASLGKDSRGKAIRKYFYGKTRKDAKTKLDEALRNYEQGLAVGSKRQTLAKFLTDWLENNAKQTLRATTYRTYEQHIRLHINPEIGWHQLGELTPAIIQKFMSDKLNGDPPLAPRTVLYTRAVLRRALGQAVRWGMLPRNPAELVDPPRVARSEIKPLSAEEAQALLEAVKGHRLEAFYSVAVGLGLRRGEALGLMWEDIDFEAGTLRVVRGLQRLDHKLQLTEVKTETSRRTIKLPRFCVTALRAHRARQLRDRAKAGESWQNTGLVCCKGGIRGNKRAPDNGSRADLVPKLVLIFGGDKGARTPDLNTASTTSSRLVPPNSPNLTLNRAILSSFGASASKTSRRSHPSTLFCCKVCCKLLHR
jgi:integrase